VGIGERVVGSRFKGKSSVAVAVGKGVGTGQWQSGERICALQLYTATAYWGLLFRFKVQKSIQLAVVVGSGSWQVAGFNRQSGHFDEN